MWRLIEVLVCTLPSQSVGMVVPCNIMVVARVCGVSFPPFADYTEYALTHTRCCELVLHTISSLLKARPYEAEYHAEPILLRGQVMYAYGQAEEALGFPFHGRARAWCRRASDAHYC
ncbi:hypothetical protein BD311DRAFT_338372 [Dichomitus squalens]|uniref:Uncharacterized protein n=1 Tax=Dichomitus squalens TaxID=114155 RepID=A0A4Q9N419_9APHY|nr:hypothetical protein BD311DRAFT_338372 [Dichomitus squalens]